VTSVHPEALILVDLQRAFVQGPDAVAEAPRLLDAARRLLVCARQAGALVVHLQNDGEPGSPDEPETSGWSLALSPELGEHVLRKRQDDGFAGTGLATILADRNVQQVVICGVQSEMCVAATARGALARRLQVILPRDAHGTYAIPSESGVGVPAEHSGGMAEWSLGNGVVILGSVADVRFTVAPPGRGDRTRHAG